MLSRVSSDSFASGMEEGKEGGPAIRGEQLYISRKRSSLSILFFFFFDSAEFFARGCRGSLTRCVPSRPPGSLLLVSRGTDIPQLAQFVTDSEESNDDISSEEEVQFLCRRMSKSFEW